MCTRIVQIENKKGERGCNILGEVYYQGIVIKTGESGTQLLEKLPTLKIKNHSRYTRTKRKLMDAD